MSKRFKTKAKITLPPDKNNKRVILTLSQNMWDQLNLIRDPSISIQETIRQIVGAYLGTGRRK